MAISATDPAYRAETTPASVSAMRQPLCAAYGVGADAFGAKGNLAHASGYHRSRRWILTSPDSRYGSSDYSVTQAPDKGGSANDVCAFDFTPGAWGTAENRRRMIEITSRVHAAAKARDPRLSALREFAGTLDGKTVVTFNCADGSLKAPFDSSHLDHCHGSLWRSRAAEDHTGIVDVMLGKEVPMTDSAAVLATHDRVYTLLAGPTTSPYPEKPIYLMGEFAKINAKIDALGVIMQHLADVVTAALAEGSGSLDVAAVLAGVKAQLEKTEAELRDAVADLGEGGAAQVRADAPGPGSE